MKNLKLFLMLFFIAISASAQNWTGTWKTNFGELRFIQEGTKVYGDYDNNGEIIANVSGDVLRGTFNNKGKEGIFEFTKNGTSFSGKWAFGTAPLGSSWTGNLVSGEVPVLTSTAKSRLGKNIAVGNIPLKIPKLSNVNLVYISKENALKKVNFKLENTVDATLQTVRSDASTDIQKTSTSNTPPNEPKKNCSSTTNNLTVNTADFSYFVDKGISPFLTPGVVMGYDSFLKGENKVFTQARSPLKLFLGATDVQPGKAAFINVSKPESLADLSQGVSNLIANTKQNLAANMSFELSEVQTAKEMSFAITGSYSNKIANIGVKAGMSTNNKNESYFLLLKFEQNMFSINVDPSMPMSFLSSVSNPDDLMYISQVTYGRKGFLIIKSSKSLAEIKASASVKIEAGVHNVDVNALYSSLKTDKSLNIKAFYYGGSADAAAKSLSGISGGLNPNESFSNWITSDAGKGGYGLPISYTISNLAGERLGMRSSFSETVQTCVPVKEYKLKITLENIKCVFSNDSDRIEDYVLGFAPELVIGNQTYQLQNKDFAYKPEKNNKSNTNDLYFYDKTNNQIQVAKGSTQNINNSGVFIIPEGADLKNAKLTMKFRLYEASGSPISLDRLVGVSKVTDYNVHNHNLLKITELLSGVKKIAEFENTCAKECGGTPFGNYGGSPSDIKYYLTAGTVPVSNIVGEKTVLRAGEYMKNATDTRAGSINYTMELVD